MKTKENTANQPASPMQTQNARPKKALPQPSKVLLTKEDPSSKVLLTKEDLNDEPASVRLAIATIDHQPSPVIINHQPSRISKTPSTLDPRPSTPNKKRMTRRTGRVASLPRLQRDMVNRMLWNGVPYKNIVAALDDSGFAVNERNISNWATGGYLEWRLEQEAVLQNRLDQDHLLDFLRRDDAPELPEVGLQAAATRLSQVLLQKLARSEDPEANLDNYSRMIDLLCRLNREISITQKQRDDSRRTLGPEYDPARVKDTEQVDAIEAERFYSDPCPDSELPKPTVPPLLPQVPTATFLADQAAEQRHEAELLRRKHSNEMMKILLSKSPPALRQPDPTTKTS
jgi:hypothetical protein